MKTFVEYGWLLAVPFALWLGPGGGEGAASLVVPLAALAGSCMLALLLADKKDGEEEDNETARTIVSMPAWLIEEEAKKKRAADTAEMAGVPKEVQEKLDRLKDVPAAPGGAGGTMVFAPGSPGWMKQEQEDAAQTVAYSAEEIRALRDTLRGKDEAAEEEGTSKTMAYMEAVKPAAPAEPGEGSAPTVAYMEAITPGKGSETIAYSPEDRARVLETMGMKGFGQEDAAGATQAYSGDEMKKMREAYDLLKKAKTAPVPTFTPDMATQPGTQPVSPEAGKEQPPAGPAAREAPALAPKSPRLSPMPDRTVPAGRSAAARAAVIAGLLVACAAVTALLLHLLGIVHLPIPLPSLF